MQRRTFLYSSGVLLGATILGSHDSHGDQTHAHVRHAASLMTDCANRFLAALDDNQRGKATFHFDADERIYAPAATILGRMGIKRVRLMTNNPEKISGLERHGIEVTERVAHSFPANGHNENYLRTKAERAGHLL